MALVVCLLATVAAHASEQAQSSAGAPRSTRVQIIKGLELIPVSAVGDGAGGVVMLGHQKYLSTLIRFDADGKVVWARQMDKIATPRRILRTARGYLVVGSEMMYVPEGVDANAGFFLDVDSEGRPTRLRRLVGEGQVLLRDAEAASGRIAVLSASPVPSVSLLNEDLGTKWTFPVDATSRVRLSALAIHGDGVVVAGEAASKCLVARIDARGAVDWANTYDLGGRNNCGDVSVGNDLIYVVGSSGLTASILALRADGAVAFASSAQSESAHRHALQTADGVLVLSGGRLERQGYRIARIFSRFTDNPFPDATFVMPFPPPDGQGGNVPTDTGELGWFSTEGRDFFFESEEPGQVLAVSSNRDSWAEDCGPFEPYEFDWKPLKLTPVPFELVRTDAPKLELVDVKLPVMNDVVPDVADNCLGPVTEKKVDTQALAMELALKAMPDIPVGPLASTPVDTLEKIKPVRRQWALLFRNGRWTELEALLKELIKPDVCFENGRLKVRELEETLLLGSEELSGLDEESYFRLIDQWRKAYPSSERPDIQASLTMRGLAWQARGTGYASTVTDEGWKVYRHYTSEIVRLMTPLVERGTKDAAPYRLLTIALGEQGEDPMPVVRRAMKITPTYHHTYEARVSFLREEWGGSPKEVQEFLDELVGTLEGSVRAEAYARTVWFITAYDPESVSALRLDREMVVAGFESILKRYPKSTRESYRYAATMCSLGNQAVARRLFGDSRLNYEPTLARTFFGDQTDFAIARVWASSPVPAPPKGGEWEDIVFGTSARTGRRDIMRGGFTTFVSHEGTPFGLTTPVPMFEPDPEKANHFRIVQGLSWSVRRRSDRGEVIEVEVASTPKSYFFPDGIALRPTGGVEVPGDAIVSMGTGQVESFAPLWVLAPGAAGRKIRPLFGASFIGGSTDFSVSMMDRGLDRTLLAGAPIVDAEGRLIGIVVSLEKSGDLRCETAQYVLSLAKGGR